MSPKRYPPDDPREWLRRAHGNVARAGIVLPDVYLEDLCFDAQKGAEKAIKAVFIARAERFPYVHDLERLLGLLNRNGVTVPKYVLQAKLLSRFAAETRYPNSEPPVTPRQNRRAVRIATGVLRWAERQVGST